jgi:hypothetical protein
MCGFEAQITFFSLIRKNTNTVQHGLSIYRNFFAVFMCLYWYKSSENGGSYRVQPLSVRVKCLVDRVSNTTRLHF